MLITRENARDEVKDGDILMPPSLTQIPDQPPYEVTGISSHGPYLREYRPGIAPNGKGHFHLNWDSLNGYQRFTKEQWKKGPFQ